jgi:penicillin-binding protein 1A
MIRLIGYFFGIGVALALVAAAGVALYLGSVHAGCYRRLVFGKYFIIGQVRVGPARL